MFSQAIPLYVLESTSLSTSPTLILLTPSHAPTCMYLCRQAYCFTIISIIADIARKCTKFLLFSFPPCRTLRKQKGGLAPPLLSKGYACRHRMLLHLSAYPHLQPQNQTTTVTRQANAS